MIAVIDLRGLPAPIVQAGMGAVARHELAAAVSEAVVWGRSGAPIAEELAAARRLTGRPIAVNLVLRLLRPGDVQAAADADVIVTFWGKPRRLAEYARRLLPNLTPLSDRKPPLIRLK